MNLKVLAMLIFYWTSFIVIFSIGTSDAFGNPLSQYNTTAEFNATDFDDDEFSGGIFSALDIFDAMGRFFGLALFGLTPALEGTLQILFSTWQTSWTLFTIGFIIDAIWSG